mmetsp:Transcript_1805/g.4004  ORF Transcript_1805/g.4004 Transcript_1805/m.4004 type:complete len:200 (+) Transcript_1805:316-915(+)
MVAARRLAAHPHIILCARLPLLRLCWSFRLDLLGLGRRRRSAWKRNQHVEAQGDVLRVVLGKEIDKFACFQQRFSAMNQTLQLLGWSPRIIAPDPTLDVCNRGGKANGVHELDAKLQVRMNSLRILEHAQHSFSMHSCNCILQRLLLLHILPSLCICDSLVCLLLLAEALLLLLFQGKQLLYLLLLRLLHSPHLLHFLL